ncbi:hypothetical protein BAUCODRAFT_294486 [Baudoinia panamericana UAMH 10762]|uniref:Uncharacterized protein n=1 Tax=Baudoinia panamericana (strain UAMH 10762) TaxID=717646 RepID=M2N0U7_BAUPA|nr:uncharacterized protein BAUCODRAFT_294486 [Baudoinia panamericana UAMH 10762]EMC92519.1 hypothetical protein BAUCODRAFT_294486 [Baudoinia panamericana UAMH 10762]
MRLAPPAAHAIMIRPSSHAMLHRALLHRAESVAPFKPCPPPLKPSPETGQLHARS